VKKNIIAPVLLLFCNSCVFCMNKQDKIKTELPLPFINEEFSCIQVLPFMSTNILFKLQIDNEKFTKLVKKFSQKSPIIIFIESDGVFDKSKWGKLEKRIQLLVKEYKIKIHIEMKIEYTPEDGKRYIEKHEEGIKRIFGSKIITSHLVELDFSGANGYRVLQCLKQQKLPPKLEKIKTNITVYDREESTGDDIQSFSSRDRYRHQERQKSTEEYTRSINFKANRTKSPEPPEQLRYKDLGALLPWIMIDENLLHNPNQYPLT